MPRPSPSSSPEDLLFLSEVRTLVGGVGIRLVPAVGPLPDVAGHVHDAVGAGAAFKRADRRDIADPRIPDVRSFRIERISPGKLPSVGSPRRLLPLRFGRKAFPRPAAVMIGLIPIDIGDRVVFPSGGDAPDVEVKGRTGAGRIDKSFVLGVGHFVSVDEEEGKADLMLRMLVEIPRFGAPQLAALMVDVDLVASSNKIPCRDGDHFRRRRGGLKETAGEHH